MIQGHGAEPTVAPSFRSADFPQEVWPTRIASQFDAVLLKINMKWEHQTWNIPVLNDFLLHRLCSEGLGYGLIFGIDDFLANGKILEQSRSDVLIACAVDQWYTDEFLASWSKLQTGHAVRVLVNMEPVYGPLAHHHGDRNTAIGRHEAFLKGFDPDIICYSSLIDCEAYKARGGRARTIFFAQADLGVFGKQVLPWREKKDALLFAGKPMVWKDDKGQYPGWDRGRQLDWFANHGHPPLVAFHEAFTHRACYDIANLFRYQLCPRSGFFFHTARALQAMALQSIPVILLPKDYLPAFKQEAPWIQPDRHCLLGFDGDYEALGEKLRDESLGRFISSNLHEVAEQISTTHSAAELARAIEGLLYGAGGALTPETLSRPFTSTEKRRWIFKPRLGKAVRRRRRDRIRVRTTPPSHLKPEDLLQSLQIRSSKD